MDIFVVSVVDAVVIFEHSVVYVQNWVRVWVGWLLKVNKLWWYYTELLQEVINISKNLHPRHMYTYIFYSVVAYTTHVF